MLRVLPLATAYLGAGTVDLVSGRGCVVCDASAPTVHVSVEQKSAAQLAVPRKQGLDANLVPVAAAAEQQNPGAESSRRLPLASG